MILVKRSMCLREWALPSLLHHREICFDCSSCPNSLLLAQYGRRGDGYVNICVAIALRLAQTLLPHLQQAHLDSPSYFLSSFSSFLSSKHHTLFSVFPHSHFWHGSVCTAFCMLLLTIRAVFHCEWNSAPQKALRQCSTAALHSPYNRRAEV